MEETIDIYRKISQQHPIVLFDGVCALCQQTIIRLIKHDPSGVLRFAPLQSAIGKSLAGNTALMPDDSADTILVYHKGQLYSKSTAVLHILQSLGGVWKLSSLGFIIPKPLRDKLYDFIAQNRYTWFGKKATCMVPTASIRARFLS